jgi:septum formation protein
MTSIGALPVVLASGSPRRAAILRLLGLHPRVLRPSDAERPHRPPEDPREYAAEQAHAKLRAGLLALEREAAGGDGAPDSDAAAARESPPDSADPVIVAADTIVLLDGRVLGKPADAAQARAMLRSLGGRTHEVVTGVAVARRGREAVGHETTRVTFRTIGDPEIAAYVASGEPLDKAGAYGIQDRGASLVRAVQGCFFNVMGLPVARLLDLLAEVEARYDAGAGVIAPLERAGGRGRSPA